MSFNGDLHQGPSLKRCASGRGSNYICANLADNSHDRVECTAPHPDSGGVAGIMSVIMLLSNEKDLAVATSTRTDPAEDDLLLYK